MSNKKKKILILTNHSYMLYRFRKELIEELMKNNEVILSMPFVGHHEDFINMDTLSGLLKKLNENCEKGQTEDVLANLKEIVKEYQPTGSS